MKTMNRWVLLAIITVTAVIFDLGTKTWAERNLASSTSQWTHGLPAVVTPDDHGKLVRQFVADTWNLDPENDVESRSFDWLYQVDPERPDVASHLRANSILDERVEHVELRYRAIEVVDGFWNFTYAENTGAAFGFLSGKAEWFRRPFFILVSILAMGMIFTMYRQVPDDKRILQVALAGVVGGALGNFIDRIRYGYVVDFIDWYITIGGEEKHWPTFNIADVYISCGVTVLIVLIVFGYVDFDDPPAKEKAAIASVPTSIADDGSEGAGDSEA